MKKGLSMLLIICLLAGILSACNTAGSTTGETTTLPQTPSGESGTTADRVDPEITDIPDDLIENANTLQITCSEGTDQCWSFDGQTLTFSGLTADTVCSISGEFDGQIVIDAGDDYRFELVFCGVKLYNGKQNPISILSGDKVTLTAKEETKNEIYDTREAVSSDDDAAISAAIYAKCDLELGGKGELIVISSNNNGIHTKDDLKIKNLTLSVTCQDNALKGNDSVSISGGILTLIAKSGDGIKTKNTDISSKGNQRGIVSITGGTVTIYAACDGIDAAYDVEISDEAIVNIYTDVYSPYSATTTQASTGSYGQPSSDSIDSGLPFAGNGPDGTGMSGGAGRPGENEDFGGNGGFGGSSGFGGNGGFGGGGAPGGNGGFGGGGRPGGGGPGGMTDGNTEKGDHSTKGIKAGNEIHISGGTVSVCSYDDSLHANSGTVLENDSTSTGNILISGGTLTLLTKDDGIHADGTLTVSDGKINVTGSYEGLEGTYVRVNGGEISIVSSDDGINATTTSGTGITFEGGKVFVYAGGDGIDSNSRTSYQGILFAGGEITVVSTSGGDSSIDTEQGYTYTGGTVLALCPANGMAGEAVNCRNFSTVGTKATMNLNDGQTLSVKVDGSVISSVTMPCRLSALVVYLGSPSATFTTD